MGDVKKIILDTAEFHPLHKSWLSLAQNLAKELGVEVEVKKEDYLFAISYGDKDDIGMAWLPQLFVQTADDKIVLVMSQYPFDPATTKPSDTMAFEEAKKKIDEIKKDP
ncbi:MAG: hypothetical protein G5Z42_04925 [Caldisphaeraceae archaeon]|nr:hypothetical protein [Caldisphaeraceae archaeon]MEB3691879.1 hypothetical protein [Caldisphaeraceae archaeon]MEB3798145.1 hypothetical protein [Caldisphaeraceae archaeon]